MLDCRRRVCFRDRGEQFAWRLAVYFSHHVAGLEFAHSVRDGGDHQLAAHPVARQWRQVHGTTARAGDAAVPVVKIGDQPFHGVDEVRLIRVDGGGGE